MYTYFTKDELEAKLSKKRACGKVTVDLKEGDDAVLVKFGTDGAFVKTTANDIAKEVLSNDGACAVVDCDEGMMAFVSEDEMKQYTRN